MTPDEWFVRADQFWSAGAILAREEHLNDEELGFPNVTCRAFAAEAYLKCLLELRGRSFPADHDLRRLFRHLPSEDQAKIEQTWTENSLPGVVSRARFNPKGTVKTSTFSQALKQSALAFKHFRYVQARANYWVLAGFPSDVRNCILNLRPEWRNNPPTLASTGISISQYPNPKIEYEVVEEKRVLKTRPRSTNSK